jgi:uncharacterized protein (TIGR02001 family)
MRTILIPLTLALTLPALPTLAADLAVYGGVALSFTGGDGDDSGTSQDLNAYVEGEFSHFYAGVSADIYNGSSNNEVDPYIGYRSETAGGLTYDVSYTRYFYVNDGGDCCGDLYFELGMPLGDKITLGANADYYPEDKLGEAHLTLDYALNDKITLSGDVGRVGQTAADGGDTTTWKVAGTYQLGDTTAVKLSYHDGEDTKAYVGLDLTWDVTLLGGQ